MVDYAHYDIRVKIIAAYSVNMDTAKSSKRLDHKITFECDK